MIKLYLTAILITCANMMNVQTDVTQEKKFEVTFNEEVGRYQYQYIFDLPGEKAQQLYDKVFRNTRQSGYLPDEKVEGKKLVFELKKAIYIKSSDDRLYYIFTMNFKDGKVRMLIDHYIVNTKSFMGATKTFKLNEASVVYAENKKKDKILAKLEEDTIELNKENFEWLKKVLAQMESTDDDW